MAIGYRALGEVALVVDGDRASLGPRTAALLALLLASRQTGVTSGRLIEEIWGDDPPADPENALHTLTSRLRTVVGDDLVTTSSGYRLEVEDFDVDLYEGLLEQARAQGQVDLYERAEEQWRGEPFPEHEDRPSVASEIERLRSQHERAKVERLTLMVEAGKSAEAVEELRELVRTHPFSEAPLALYMKALYAAGRKPDALRAFRHHAETLAEETGLEPSKDLRELELSILLDQMETLNPPSREPVKLPIAVRYIERAPGETVAVGTVGEGQPMFVHPGWLSKLDATASGLDFRSDFWSRLSRDHELVLFDRYGTGLSRGAPTDFSFDTSVSEMQTVMRATLDGPAPLLAASQAGPMSIRTAVEMPELVSSLILLGTFASGPDTFPPRIAESFTALVRASWGMGSNLIAGLLFPGGSAEHIAGFARFQREAATPEVAAGLFQQPFRVDVSDLLSKVTVPTLIIHYRGDRAISVKAAETMARLIPHADYMPLEGISHYPLPHHFEQVIERINGFVAEAQADASRLPES